MLGENLDAGSPIQASINDCLERALIVVVQHDPPSESLNMVGPGVIDGLRRIWGCRGMSGGIQVLIGTRANHIGGYLGEESYDCS